MKMADNVLGDTLSDDANENSSEYVTKSEESPQLETPVIETSNENVDNGNKRRSKRNIITVPSRTVKHGDTQFRRDKNGRWRPVFSWFVQLYFQMNFFMNLIFNISNDQ